MHKAVRSLSIVLALTLSHPVFAGLDVPYPSGVERLFTEQTENGTFAFQLHHGRNNPAYHMKSAAAQSRFQHLSYARHPSHLHRLRPHSSSVTGRRIPNHLGLHVKRMRGFDYRVNTPIVSPPNMYVNLRDFLSMTGTKGSDQIINILISRIGERVYIQERRVDPAADAPVTTSKIKTIARPKPATHMNDQFTQTGAVTLDGLDFTSGSTNLGEGPFSVLSELADYLRKIQIQKLYWSVTAMRLAG